LPIDFLAIGHLTHDRTPAGFRVGGTVSYSAVTAQRLGRHAGILTRGTLEGFRNGSSNSPPENVTAPADSPLHGVAIHMLPSAVSTTFSNIYHAGQRTQILEALAQPIEPEDLPAAWAGAAIVLLGPLVREVPPAWVNVFPNALLGVTPQGWMRRWDTAGRVSPTRWDNAAEFLSRADVVILSREDVGGDEAYIAVLAAQARLMIVTDGWHGATIYQGGSCRHVPPRPTQEIDPTGAGDVFATAFLIRLAETADPFTAAQFANVVASMSVEGVGVAGIPFRARVEAWLADHR